MSSFDPETFLRETLDDVWNGKAAGRLYERAAATVAVHGPSGQELYGREDAIAEIIAWLAAFPDTVFEIEDLIWNGDERRGFLVSVRHSRRATNRSAGIYGPATGRAVTLSGISHFLVQGGLIREIWQECDEAGLIGQLGLDRDDVLARLARVRRPAPAAEPFGVGEIRRSLGQLPPAPDAAGDPAQGFLKRSLHDIWNRRLVGRIEQVYRDDLRWRLGGQEPAGRAELIGHVLARLSAFPDLCLHIDQLIWQGREVLRTAIRWTLLGTHTGPGMVDLPTGRRIRLQGITQQRLEAGRIVAEWTECGELGLAAQLAPQAPDDPQEFPALR